MAVVLDTRTCSARKVKNLGWLLRHRKDGITRVATTLLSAGRAVLTVEFGSVLYSCSFEDWTVCLDWIDRHLVQPGWAGIDTLDDNLDALLRERKGLSPRPLPYFDPREP
jgi:hypothetical protein